MAVEARHLNLFPSQQLITNRDLINTNQGNTNMYNTQMGFGGSFAGTMPETLLPFHQSLLMDSVPAKTSMKADSGLTYNIPAPRKRTRDSINQLDDALTLPPKNNNLSQFSSLIGELIPFQIHQQQQSEIDCLVAEHTKKVRLELEESQKRHSRLLVSAINEGIVKKVKEKEEEIQRMGKLNWILQEKVKSLFIENQLWRDLAQTNEATANSLRSNLEQVLAHVSDERSGGSGGGGGGGGGVADDVESCCGSSDYGREDRRTLAAGEGVKDKEVSGGGNSKNRMCRKCGERESCVLLLPCRHLCLCTLCGSTLHTCPVCNTNMNASVHVNMS